MSKKRRRYRRHNAEVVKAVRDAAPTVMESVLDSFRQNLGMFGLMSLTTGVVKGAVEGVEKNASYRKHMVARLATIRDGLTRISALAHGDEPRAKDKIALLASEVDRVVVEWQKELAEAEKKHAAQTDVTTEGPG